MIRINKWIGGPPPLAGIGLGSMTAAMTAIIWLRLNLDTDMPNTLRRLMRLGCSFFTKLNADMLNTMRGSPIWFGFSSLGKVNTDMLNILGRGLATIGRGLTRPALETAIPAGSQPVNLEAVERGASIAALETSLNTSAQGKGQNDCLDPSSLRLNTLPEEIEHLYPTKLLLDKELTRQAALRSMTCLPDCKDPERAAIIDQAINLFVPGVTSLEDLFQFCETLRPLSEQQRTQVIDNALEAIHCTLLEK